MTTTLSGTENRADRRGSEYTFDATEEGASDEQIDESAAREATICVVGLGYVGLPLAVGFAQSNYRVVGYDVDETTVEQLQAGVDTTGDLSDDAIQDGDISYTTDAAQIGDADYVIIAVPTPIDDDDQPDLRYVESAATTVGSKMKPGTTVVLESTVYPGTTREVLAPALEEASDLTAGEGFFVGYSPERATPGDEAHGLADVVKVVGAQNEKVLDDVAALYESVVDAGVHRAPSIEVAEACKVVENTQRDLNIAFVNELSMALERMDVDADAVLEAAGTKWNFHDYRPGLVGGHCIPVDPYFLAHRSAREGFEPELVRTSRKVNESMPDHVAELTIKALNQCHKTLCESRVLVLGLSYKPGVGDIRSSKVANVVERLEEYDIDVTGFDPFADPEAVRDAFGIDVQEAVSFDGFDAVVVTTGHDEFERLDLENVASALESDPALVDTTGTFDETVAQDAGFVYRRI
ncbi:nucleotide sugar dehydrogenase [Natronolimnohabitans innermongolicus]|uniref:UDP-N-acetyl-D-mannosamine dehydrogenase n=1 Tax=Natronolimnohabitans innermongolicus JCM 12255 TaxID=1227499 RepID=L9XGU9_9EURY|nr:nucleotide sugar dehydrogenase [Natronolimnohabitans innermongolicus]ELY60626.1 nucleotide sugar dehydrogenase [Natronolimnohabitans innermongolicus JCM 12255]